MNMIQTLSDLSLSWGIDPFVGGFLLGVILTLLARGILSRGAKEGVSTHSSELPPQIAFSGGELGQSSTIMNITVGGQTQELSPATVQEVMGAIQKGQKIEAIKLLRNATHIGLKEAKELVEAIQAQKSTPL